MAQTVADLMTREPVTIEGQQSVVEAARAMRSADTGDVIVLDNGGLVGIVTDRDLALRVVADELPLTTPVREVCSDTELVTVAPDTSLTQAVQLMRTHAVRRLPVLQQKAVVGVISLGDLAIELDEDSALADISAAEENN